MNTRYFSIQYYDEIAEQREILKSVKGYYDKTTGELVGIEVLDAKLLAEEINELKR